MPVIPDKQIAAAAKAGGFVTRREIAVMTAIALAESSGNTEAKNSVGAGHYGLWQISALHFNPSQVNWRDPVTNAKLANTVYRKQGYRAWSVYNSGRYLAFYRRGDKAAGDPGSLGDYLPTVPNPLDPFQDLTNAAEFLTNPENWKRLGWFAIGTTLLVIAFFKMTGDNQLSPMTKEAIKTVATRGLNKVGKVAKAA